MIGNMKLLLPALWLACLASPALALSPPAPGCAVGEVFEDRNGDGRRDPGEPGLAGIAVSNGHEVVRTDAEGRYHLPLRADAAVFVIKPAGYDPGRRPDGLPDHWRGPGEACRPFALRPAASPQAPLEVRVFGDPQPKSAVDVDHYRRSIVAPLAGRTRARLGLSLGDIVDDDLSLYPEMIEVTTSLGIPWLHAPGNHDLVSEADDDGSLATFGRHFGPDTFAWEEPEAVFVVLDNVIWQPRATPKYIGGFRASQLAFLDAYLRDAPRDRLLVLAMHIPLFEPAGRDTFRDADRERLFALLCDFPHVLVLSAHHHTQQHVFHGADTGWRGARALHEYNVGATCGAFWSGAPDARGIPDATMADGTPHGHAVLEIGQGGDYRLRWQPARGGVDPWIGLHAPRVLRQGAYPAWGVYANVWMGVDDTEVEYRVDGGEWKPMRKVLQPDPALLLENARDDLADALRGFDRSPEAVPSTHLWRGALPTTLETGEHRVEVRARDRWHGWQEARIHYRLETAEP